MSRPVALALVRDLFFRSKIDAVATAVGAEIGYASTLDAVALRCAELKPAIVFSDLSDDAFPAVETLRQIRAAAPGARVIGFASHVDLNSIRAARDAGYELTLSRSEFTARLADLLRP
jgi:DNA-binding NarL/FixJ family response regulator